MFQVVGVARDYFAGRAQTPADLGRENVTGRAADRHHFKVPSLRNVELTAPYFHDGSAKTLADAVRVMGHVQLGRTLDDEEVRLLVAFLASLTAPLPLDAALPPGVPR
jgi:cytochrome c peroxidase